MLPTHDFKIIFFVIISKHYIGRGPKVITILVYIIHTFWLFIGLSWKIVQILDFLCLQFINDRLDMLNDGRGFADIFEQECLVHADKLNSKTRYDEWAGKMKVSFVRLRK